MPRTLGGIKRALHSSDPEATVWAATADEARIQATAFRTARIIP